MKSSPHSSRLKPASAGVLVPALCLALLVVLSGCVSRPPPPPEPIAYDPAFDAAERARIEAERTEAEQRFGERERDCYQRFAVNACLKSMRRERREVMEALHRREIVLNDARRADQAERQRLRVQQREAEREQRLQDSQSGGRP